MKFFLNIKHAYSLNCQKLLLQHTKIKEELQILKNNFIKSTIDLIKNDITNNFNLQVKVQHFNFKVYNGDNQIIEIKLIRDINEFSIRYKLNQTLYSQNKDIKNLISSIEIIKFIESNKEYYITQIKELFKNSNEKISFLIKEQESVLKQIKENQDKQDIFLQKYISSLLLKPPYTVNIHRPLALKKPNEIGSLDIWPYIYSITNTFEKGFKVKFIEACNNRQAFKLLTQIQDAKTNRWYYKNNQKLIKEPIYFVTQALLKIENQYA